MERAKKSTLVKDNSLLAIANKKDKKKTVVATANKKLAKKVLPVKKTVKPVVLNKKKAVAVPA